MRLLIIIKKNIGSKEKKIIYIFYVIKPFVPNMCVLKVGSKKQPIGRYGFIWGHFPLIFGIYKKKNLSKWFLSIINKKVKILSLFFFSEKSRGGSQGAQGTPLRTLLLSKNNIMANLFISVFTKLKKSYKYYFNFPNTEISFLYYSATFPKL